MNRITLLGVPIDSISALDAKFRILELCRGTKQCHVMTPNNEMLREASRNVDFKKVLQNAYLSLPDSTGLRLTAWVTQQRLKERVTGVDTVVSVLLELGSDIPVFLLGGKSGVGIRVRDILKQKNPRLNIAGVYEGTPREEDAREIVQKINEVQPILLLVAYGAPAQDMWIAKHLPEIPSVRVAMGVGGTFDFIAGTQHRAPKVLQRFGLEWLWRFICEPWRIKRMWNAVVVFPLLVMWYGKKSPNPNPNTDFTP